MVIAFGLGSNLGNRLANLREAARRLEAALGPLVGRSDVFETEPWGGVEQPWYLNACVTVDVDPVPEPLALLSAVKGMEREMGRAANVRWGARKIDIDILLMGDLIFHSPELQVPHVQMSRRLFVLTPLCQVLPQWVHPELGLSPPQMAAKIFTVPSAISRAVQL